MFEWLRYRIKEKPLIKPLNNSNEPNPPIVIIPPKFELDNQINIEPGSINYLKPKPEFRSKYITIERMKFRFRWLWNWFYLKEWYKDLKLSREWKKEIRSLLKR